MIVIIDYNMGNLRSVEHALETLGEDVCISSDPDVIDNAKKLILPGVGAFPDAMANLIKFNLINVIQRQVLTRKIPILGICLGMQLLSKKGWEFGETSGLGLIDAEIVKFESSDKHFKIPHIGWNEIKICQPHPLLRDIKTGDTFYFIHSYYMQVNNPENIVATCYYGLEFACAIKQSNIFATQFHPEKSQENGLKILKAFIDWEGN